MKMVNAKGEAVYFNRVMKNGREQFVVKALDGQHIMGRDRQKHSSRTFTELHQAEAFLRRAGYSRAKSAKHMIRDPNCRNDRWAVAKLDAIIEGEIRKLAFDPAALELAVSGPQQGEDAAQRRAALQQHLEDLRGQMGRVLDLYQMGGALSASMVGDRVAKLQAVIDGVEAALAEAVEEPPTQRLDAARAALVGAEDVLDNGTLDEKRELVHSLIRRIDLDGENIDIHWSFAPEN